MRRNPSRSEDDPAFCPSCERYIGPSDVCPFCDADSARPAVLRRIRAASLLLGIVGVAVLLAVRGQDEIPLVRASDITPLMNFSLVRVAGLVVGDPYVGRDRTPPDYAAFSVHDGSGEVRALARNAVASQLVEQALIPRKGATVEICGHLSVRADQTPALRLRHASDVRAARPQAGEAP